MGKIISEELLLFSNDFLQADNSFYTSFFQYDKVLELTCVLLVNIHKPWMFKKRKCNLFEIVNDSTEIILLHCAHYQ